MAKSPPITKKSQLVDYIASGEKPKEHWRIGSEHEKFLYNKHNQQRVAYFGKNGIQELLTHLQKEKNWKPIWEGEYIIGLIADDGGSVTLEPGGQLELSGAPLENLHQSADEIFRHIELLLNTCRLFDIQMFALGHDPLHNPESLEWMPKGRYKLMRGYMEKKGKKGTEMMTQTCTVQVNLDFSSEADMVKKFRASLALQPIISAIFANSPIKDGKLTDMQSTRMATWQDTDPDRTGFPKVVFDDGFGYEAWVDYLLTVPMYFVKNKSDNHEVIYNNALGQDFRKFMAGELPEFKNRPATLQDWEDHLTVVFTEVRLKTYLEMRGADSGEWQQLYALPAIWVGLLYDGSSLDAAYDIIAKWQVDDMVALGKDIIKNGLKAKMGKFTALDFAKECLLIAEQGLQKRSIKNDMGQGEDFYLEFVRDVVFNNQTQSDRIIRKIKEDYQGDVMGFVKKLSF